MFNPDDLVHAYTRADALADGVLVDVSAVAREAGIRFPVAPTRAVWERCVTVPPGVLCQDEAGRLGVERGKVLREVDSGSPAHGIR